MRIAINWCLLIFDILVLKMLYTVSAEYNDYRQQYPSDSN